MARVHLGRLVGPIGFSRTVAIKRLHAHLASDPSFVKSFADEACLAARIRHPNVVPTLDVVSMEDELLLVMEYVDGDSLRGLTRGENERVPLPIVVAIVSEMLHGLHAAHEARSESGEPLSIVHRDVSPQNVLVGADGVARLVDFGIARANNISSATAEGDVKGKLAYMAPEQVRGEAVTRHADIFAAGVVLWELLTGGRLFAGDDACAIVEKILVGWVPAPNTVRSDVPESLCAIAMRALDAEPSRRWESAREMAVALEEAIPRALSREVAAWVAEVGAAAIQKRRALVQETERMDSPEDNAEWLTDPSPAEAHPRREPQPSRSDLTRTVQLERSLAAPLDLVTEPTFTSFESALDLEPVPAKHLSRPRRGLGLAVATFALLATVLGYTFRGGVAAPAIASSHEPEAVTNAAPAPAPLPAMVLSAPTDPTAPLLPSASAPLVAKPAEPTPAVLTTAPRRATRPASRVKTRAPCVARQDPVTQKRVYQGDCD